jgi:hypothetical protein
MWYYLLENKPVGPVSREDLMRLVQEGTLSPDVHVWTEGLARWQPASTIFELRGQIGPEGQPAPQRVRPTSVTVLGILNIVFGSLGLIYTPSIVEKQIQQRAEMLQLESATMAYRVGGYIGSFSCMILLLAAGIGLLYQKRWARQCSYGYGWFAIVCGLLLIIKAAISDYEIQFDYLYDLIIGLIYPIILVIFMKRPNVVEACQK